MYTDSAMSKTNEKKPGFRFDAKAFLRDSATIELPLDPNDPTKVEKITFRELSKTDFEKFVQDVFQINIVENPDADEDHRKRKDFEKLAEEVSGPLKKWLAKSSGKDEAFFDTFEENFSMRAFGLLLQVLYEVNHVEEVLATGGNLALLPTVQKIMEAEPETQESQE